MKIAHVLVDGRSILVRAEPEREAMYPLLDRGGKPFSGPDFGRFLECVTECGVSAIEFGPRSNLSAARIAAPVPQPRRNIFCVGKNYREHALEFERSGYDASSKQGDRVTQHPIIFTKATTTIIGHGDAISLHGTVTNEVDYEAELAVIIGREGRAITEQEAYAHVFGYTIINDVTARDLQLLHKQWFLGKSLDTFCPMGPWIVTADALEPENLDLTCRVNGELRQSANTSQLIFSIPKLIATISAALTLLPGDIIATGTPAGVGVGLEPPRFLAPGDCVEITVSGIGTLANNVKS